MEDSLGLEDLVALVALRNAYYYKTKRLELTSPEYQLRRVFRAYSEKFHTPLHVVEELPIEYVLLHYFEALYEEDEPKDMLAEIERIVRSPEETERMKIAEDEMDAISWRDVEEERKAAAKDAVAKLDNLVKDFARKNFPTPLKTAEETRVVGNSPPPPKQHTEGIKMRFVPEDEVDDEADSFGIFSQPAGPKTVPKRSKKP